MAKVHRIKALDEHSNPREISSYGAWRGWRTPAAWTALDIAALGHRPGVYLLRAISHQGKPVLFPMALSVGAAPATANDLQRRTSFLQGVLYVGKAVDLTHRFGSLAASWQNSPPKREHTSARNYLRKDAAFRNQFPATQMELNCMPIGSKDWTDKSLTSGLLGLPQDWFWRNYPHWTHGHGNGEMDQTCAATIDRERSMMCMYRQAFGDFPPLNRRLPNCIGARLDQAWLDQLFSSEIDPAHRDDTADAQVGFLDPANPEDQSMIHSANARRQNVKKKGRPQFDPHDEGGRVVVASRRGS